MTILLFLGNKPLHVSTDELHDITCIWRMQCQQHNLKVFGSNGTGGPGSVEGCRQLSSLAFWVVRSGKAIATAGLRIRNQIA